MPLFGARQVGSTVPIVSTSLSTQWPGGGTSIVVSIPVTIGSTIITGASSANSNVASSTPSSTTAGFSTTTTEQASSTVSSSQTDSSSTSSYTPVPIPSASTASASVYAYSTVLASPETSGAVITGQQNFTYPATSSFPFTTTIAEALPAGYQVSGYVNVTLPQSSPSPKSHGLSPGATAGIAIGTAIIGALIAGAAVFMLTKKKRSRRHGEQNSALTQSEKAPGNNAYTDKAAPFDLDRLLPQPLDDAAMRNQSQNLFAQIDAHVDSFYSDAKLQVNKSPAVGVNQDQQATEMLANPATRLFMIKKIITAAMLESISPECSSNRSLLPYGFTTVARRLCEPSIDDHGKSMCVSPRLR